jgi:predicted dehydrogenase
MATKKALRWGILGCAPIAERALIPALREARNAELHGLAARDASRARAWAAKHGFAKAYPDYAALLDDPEIDAVYIPLPNHLHALWAVRAAAAGKHVLCEKPMALGASEVRRMIRAADRAGTLLMEAFMYRFHPLFEKALALVRGGSIGEVRFVRGAFTFAYAGASDNYRWDPASGGGALFDVGCYPLSAVRAVLAAEPVSVFARARFHPERGVDMSAALILEFPDRRYAHCDCGFESQYQSSLEVVGTDGRLVLPRAYSTRNLPLALDLARGDRTRTFPFLPADPYRRMVEHFGDAVLRGLPLRYPAEEALGNARTLDAAFRSIRTGRPVALA